MRGNLAVIMILTAILASGCGRERPTVPEGDGTIALYVADTSGTFPGSLPGEPFLVEGVQITLESRTHVYATVGETDTSGVAVFDNLADGAYSAFARAGAVVGAFKVVMTGFADLRVENGEELLDTILVNTIATSDLMINEIFYAGSCAASYYFYDQFVELYNGAEDTLYLDNLIITRQLGVVDPEMENKDYVRAIYAFQLKGTGKQWPIAPGQIMVVAADAVDHSRWCSNSPDLSHADFEFFNALGADYDVPEVPNFESITNRTADFLINLVHNAVVIATGDEWTIDEDNYVRIPVANVIDGVEYSANPSSAKELTLRVDAGFAGVGVTRYSATSVERRELGLDSNNSTFDFVNIKPVTPGFFHGSKLLWVH